MASSPEPFLPWSEVKNRFAELDYWLLPVFANLGATQAFALAEDRHVQRAGGDPPLTAEQVQAWLRSGADRGLLEPQTIGISGRPIRPPRWYLTDAGRERLRSVSRHWSDRVPIPVLRSLLRRTHRKKGPSWLEVIEAVRQAETQWVEQAPSKIEPEKEIVAATHVRGDKALTLLNERVDHIVVLMLENRSFDHMLGYLRLWGHQEVDGLTGANDQANSYEGEVFKPRQLRDTRLPKSQDPCHSINCVHDQLETVDGYTNGGFVANFASHVDSEEPGVVMGYHTGDQLPVYNYLANNFLICDAWHSSVPGSTWVNRLYAMCGKAEPDHEGLSEGLWDYESFPRRLDEAKIDWRWYSYDPASLRVADSAYRNPLDFRQESFRFFDRRIVQGPLQKGSQVLVGQGDGFFDDCRQGALPSVSWIDPNFVDLSIGEHAANDDHPPSDLRAGQELVLQVLRALIESPKDLFSRTMLIITYDEHGGFWDHVPPPRADYDPVFPRLGVRVPAFIVSPWVEPGSVSHTVFDHTSITRTILERFAPEARDSLGPRVAGAEHLGGLLGREEAAAHGDYGEVVEAIANWRATVAGDAVAASPVGTATEPGPEPALEGFAAEVAEAARLLRADGLPAGQP